MPRGRLVSLFILGWVSVMPALAQRYAELLGVILDTSGGRVADAVITVVDEDTGFRRQVQSEPGGTYSVSSLVPGSYEITVRKEGFRTLRMFNVKLSGGAATRQDFDLPVGRVEDSITVVGTAPALERPDASTGGQFDQEDVTHLPLNGRGVLTLLELIPGTNVVPATRGDAGQFTTSGMRPNTNYFTVDGVSANNGVSAGGLPAQSNGGALPALSAFGSLDSIISLEAVQEFRTLTSSAVAEFGRMPGASIALNSRAGTEAFHGAALFHYRNAFLGSNDWFANAAGLGRAPLGYEDLAPTVGGPIRRNRTFFFLSYEHVWLNQPYVWEQPVPSLDVRQTPGLAQAVLNLFPVPNQGSLSNGVSQWIGQINRPAGLTTGSARIDQAITPRVTLLGRYNDSPSHNDFGTPQVNHLDLRSQSLTIGLNARPTARGVLDFRANESQSTADSVWTDSPGDNAPSCALEPLAAAFLRTDVSCDYLVRFSINGIGQLVSGREGSRRQRQFQIVQTAGFDLGRHALKFGVDYRRILAIRRDPTGSLGLIVENMQEIGNAVFWWRAITSPVNQAVAVNELSSWAQDTWQVSKRLTIAGGLRWEYSPAPGLPSQPSFLDPATVTLVAQNQPLWPLTHRNFAPRLGAAWRITADGRTVLRAGGGLYYDSSVSIATDVLNGGPLSIQNFQNLRTPFSTQTLNYGFEPDLRLPQVKQWNASLERGFGTHDVVSLGYVGSAGRYLIRREVFTSAQAFTALTTNHSLSDYDALQFQYRRHVAAGLDAAASYSWSHSLDNDSSDAFLLWTDPPVATAPSLVAPPPPSGVTARGDHASSDFDLRQSFTGSAGYELPQRTAHTLGSQLLNGWAVEGIVHARSGFPITVLDSEEYLGLTLVNAFRPNWVYGQPLWIPSSSAPGGKVLNPAAYQASFPYGSLGTQGTLGRNVPAGFGMWQVDLALKREFHLGEQRGIQLRVEAYNALNHANFADPARYLDSPVFGQSPSMLNMMLGTGSPGSGLAPILQTGGPRSVQASLRFHF